MIIPNRIVKLDYDPTKDVLSVEWPDFRDYTLSEGVQILDIIVETVRLYDVKYLLTDTRCRMIEVPDATYKRIILKFARDLTATRLQKLARVVTVSTTREKPINEVRQEANLTIPMKNFYTLEEAFHWLISQQPELSPVSKLEPDPHTSAM